MAKTFKSRVYLTIPRDCVKIWYFHSIKVQNINITICQKSKGKSSRGRIRIQISGNLYTPGSIANDNYHPEPFPIQTLSILTSIGRISHPYFSPQDQDLKRKMVDQKNNYY